MVPSLDCGVSSLLCSEDNSIFYDDGDFCGYNGDMGFVVEEHRNHRIINQSQNRYQNENRVLAFDGLPLQSEECLAVMVNKECDYFPASDYLKRLRNGDLDMDGRIEAIDWIAKVHAHYNFGPLSAYLSISYMDRFLSAYEIPKGKAWMMQLVAVACLSLAAKMEETKVPQYLDLQVGESQFIFEAKVIKRMELIVLSTLKWRMQAVTPFSFLDYFLEKINGGQPFSGSSITKSTNLILSTLREIDFLEFRPSEIAAAVAISVKGETQTEDIEKAMDVLIHLVQKDRVMKCVEMMKDLRDFFVHSVGVGASSVPQSPVGVLEAACLSYKIDDAAVGSCPNSSPNSPIPKRRKLNLPFEAEF